MEFENMYLLDALSEMKCVVLAKRYTLTGTDNRSKVEYVSPNANVLGMNVDALINGYRLAEDYIHPEDRGGFLEAVDMAVKKKKGFKYSLRIVGDDGVVRSVNLSVGITDISETGYVVEYIVSGIALKKSKKKSDNKKDEFLGLEYNEVTEELFGTNKIAEVVQSIAGIDDIYSTMVDLNGKIVIKPAGPVTYMGDFYDMFERPMYKELYEKIKDIIINKGEPIYMEMDDGNPESRISAAPIIVEGQHIATWLLCAYNKEQAERLKNIYEHQWMIAELVSEYLHTIYHTRKKAGMVHQSEEKLEFEIKQKEVITKTLSRMSTNIDKAIDKMFAEAGKLLDLDNVLLYTEIDKKNHVFGLNKYWNSYGEDVDAALAATWNRETYLKEEQKAMDEGGFFVDHSNITNSIRVGVLQGKMRAVIVYPVVVKDSFMGWLIFMECKEERNWTKAEKAFTKELSRLVNRMMNQKIGEGGLERVNKILIDTYNHIKVGIFIRDICTGRVMFSNDKLNKMLGYDFTGKDSRLLITDLHDKLYDIQGMRDTSIAENKVMRWTKYIDALGAIVDITEIQIEWLNGEPASLIILRTTQD